MGVAARLKLEEILARRWGRKHGDSCLRALSHWTGWRVPTEQEFHAAVPYLSRQARARKVRQAKDELADMRALPPFTGDDALLPLKVAFGIVPASALVLPEQRCLSPFHLLRVFQTIFRQTPHQYLNQCRLERAKFLLEKTRIPVTAICLECGFTSLGSFSGLFHKRCGMSPRAWRKSRGVRSDENSNIQEVYLMGAT